MYRIPCACLQQLCKIIAESTNNNSTNVQLLLSLNSVLLTFHISADVLLSCFVVSVSIFVGSVKWHFSISVSIRIITIF